MPHQLPRARTIFLLLPPVFGAVTIVATLAFAATCSALSPMSPMSQLHVVTPLLHSLACSLEAGVPVMLKMEPLQPSGSFKDRGMGHLCSHLKQAGARRLISSSGGNAGHSVAHAGRVLGIPVKVIVPETTKAIMLDRIRAQGAEVVVHGVNWNAADELARKLVEEDPLAEYISPYDHPLLWEGHSTLIDEIANCGQKPGAIIASVGGGGLVCGIYEGLAKKGWSDVTVIAVETEGAASFNKALEAGRPVRLSSIDTVATSLGALEVTAAALDRAAQQPTVSKVVTDAEAVNACARFAQDHRMLVEPACGAALAMVYSERQKGFLAQFDSVAIVVCGGSGVSCELLSHWQEQCT